MKKSLLTLLAFAAIYMPAGAEQVSADRAAAIASKVLPHARFDQPRKARPVKGAEAHETPYYVFNANGSNGYVIVAGDDRLPAVLGYADEGSLDIDNAPEALIALLQMSVDLIDVLEDKAAEQMAGEIVVAPLLGNTNWGQDVPFNTMCPKLSDGTTGYVGCVATAMTQIMRYYGYPDRGEGSHSYRDNGKELSADFGATTYDWTNMPSMVPDNPTAAQVAAYSTLCSQVGIAVEMQYAPGGSGAYTMMVPGALKDYFGYSQSLRMHSRSYYNSEEWMSMIRGELDASRPVYYAASSEDGLGGHAFVCDGYDTEGYVHINWGWYGRSNGYFAINHLNPGELGEGGGSGAYNLSQEIITDFKPRTAGDQTSSTIYASTRFSPVVYGGDMTFMSVIENLDTKPFEGELLAVLTDLEDHIVCVLKSDAMTVPAFEKGRAGAYWATMRDIPVVCPVTVADGNYRLHFGYRMDGCEAEVLRHSIGLPGYGDCHVADNTITFDGQEVVTPKVEVTDLCTDGDLYVNGSARFLAHVNNQSPNFRLSKIVLKLTNVDNPALTCQSATAVNIYDLCEADVVMDVDLPAELPEGDYRVTMYHDGKEDYIFDCDETVVSLLPERSTPVIRFTGKPVFNNATTGDNEIFMRDHRMVFSLPLKNYGAAGTAIVFARLQSLDKPELASTVLGATSIEWIKGQSVTSPMAAVVRVEPGRYRLSYHVLGADGCEASVDGYDADEVITVEESATVPFEVTEFNFPSVLRQGERVACSVTVKATNAYSGSFFVRVRQFTYSKGELAYMTSLRLAAGETKTINFYYRPGTSLVDGMYLTMVEGGSSSNQLTAAGHDIYYKEIVMGDVPGASVDEVTVDGDNVDPKAPVEWFDIHGRRVTGPSSPGLYIIRQGSIVEKIVIK